MEGGAPKMASGAGFKGEPEKAKLPVREMVRTWVKLLSCEEEAKPISSTIQGITTVVYTGGRDGAEVILTTIDGHGHIWPGGKSPLPAFILGKATSRLNANDAVGIFSKPIRNRIHEKLHVIVGWHMARQMAPSEACRSPAL